MKEFFDLLGLALPFRAKVVIAGTTSLFMGGWILALHYLIPELWWTGVALLIAGVALLCISLRGLTSTKAKGKSTATDRDNEKPRV